MCTQLHINDTGIGLNNGLYKGYEEHPTHQKYGHYTYQDWIEFGTRIGITEKVAKKTLAAMIDESAFIPAASLVDRCFMPSELREDYTLLFHSKMKQLRDTRV